MNPSILSLLVDVCLTISAQAACAADTTGGIRSILSGDPDEDAQLTQEELCTLQTFQNEQGGLTMTLPGCDNPDGQVDAASIGDERIRRATEQNNRVMKKTTEKLKEVTDRPIKNYAACKSQLLRMMQQRRQRLGGPLGNAISNAIPSNCPQVKLTLD